MPKYLSKYGWDRWTFNPSYTPTEVDLLIELICIQKGGRFKGTGTEIMVGEGLLHHVKAAMDLMWPEDDHHRWSDMIVKSLCEHEITSIMGSADSGKTYTVAKFILTDWWADPEKTLWMISSTELRGAELRIWGTIKQLFNRARARFEFLEGSVLESKHAIVTEEIDEDNEEARLLTKGLIFIPCISGNSWRGMGLYAGVKPQPGGKLRHAGDETSVMNRSFLDAYANWYGKENFKGVLTGNPTGLEDPLCIASEPLDGWNNWVDSGKTQEWESKFYGAHVIALDGRDSPNDDYPGDKPKFSFLTGKKKRDAVAKTLGEDSPLWWNQCVGKPRPGAEASRVITRRLCEENRAFEKVVWGGTRTTQIVSLDAAYGGVGGDRCVLMRQEFGTEINGHQIFRPHPPVIVPVSVRHSDRPEVQIAKFSMAYCLSFAVPPENFFFDGRASLAVEFARIWSAQVNVVDFGGQPTERPVSLDEFIYDSDKKMRRLKLAKEHYSKFVTELWFTVFYVIISQQMRELPPDVAEEGAKRLWRYAKRSGVQGRLIEVETKAEMKERTHQSPDVFDTLVVGLEGARRRGFQVAKLAQEDVETNREWVRELAQKAQDRKQERQLDYAA